MYGYSTSSNGFSRVVCGVAEKVTRAGGVTIKVRMAHMALHGGSRELYPAIIDTRVNINPIHLFPIDTKYV